MKFRRMMSAAIAAATVFTPLSFRADFTAFPSWAYAAGTDEAASLPGWIPDDLDSVIKFRNTYGGTYIKDGLICVVFEREAEIIPEGEPQGVMRYMFRKTEGVAEEVCHNGFICKETLTAYDIIVYKPVKQGEFEVMMIDTLKAEGYPDYSADDADACYDFSFDADLNITETDIYSWLPDSASEFSYYVSTEGKISSKDEYVVFCLTENAGTGYVWEELSKGHLDYFESGKNTDCSERSKTLTEGGTENRVCVYKAKKDGECEIPLILHRSGSTDNKDNLKADCVIINDAQNVLLSDNSRIALIDKDTGKYIDTGNTSFTKQLTHGTGDQMSVTAIIANMSTNPGIVRGINKHIDENNFGFNFNMPKGYDYLTDDTGQLAEDAIKITKLANGAFDISIWLRKIPERVLPEEKSAELTDLSKGETKITVKDAETGKLIPDSTLKETPLRIKPSINNSGAYRIVYYTVDSNNKVFDNDLAELYRNADSFSFWYSDGNEEPEVTLYDNGAMEVVFSINTSMLSQTDLFPGQVRVSVTDGNTGKLIADEELNELPFRFRPESLSGVMYSIYTINKNNSVYEHRQLTDVVRSDDFGGFWNNYNNEKAEIKIYDNASADIIFKVDLTANGDVNDDGSFNIADAVTLQKYLLAVPDNELKNWKSADFCKDNQLDVFDLCLMKKALLK